VKGAVYHYFGDDYLTKGSFDDLQRLGITPEEGMRLTFYEIDSDEENRPIYLCAEGTLQFGKETSTWYVSIEQDTFRSILRSEADE
jgi:hypothetical protein